MNTVTVKFQDNINNTYEAVCGAVQTDEFGEPLDSFILVLDQVPASKRLDSLHPYEYAQVTVNGTKMLYLVDTFTEKITNVSTLLYQYTITLMSETKMLEKWQCPNLVITHSKLTGQKTIAEVIKEYYDMYVPKVKTTTDGATWSYQPFLGYDTAIASKFNVPCKDLSMSQPTLRQALTALMSQIGCIPRVHNHVLTYLDLRADSREQWSDDGATVNYIERSMSSDSYITSLVNMGDSFLDTNNEVRNEVVGFRDRDSAVLSKQKNLVINTQMPIYKVTRLLMDAYAQGTFRIGNVYPNDGDTPEKSSYQGTYITIDTSTLASSVIFTTRNAATATIGNVVITWLKQGTATKYAENGSSTIATSVTFTGSYTWNGTAPSGTIAAYVTFLYNNTYNCLYMSFVGSTAQSAIFSNLIFPFSIDITKLCVEKTARQCLKTDYTKLPASGSGYKTVAELSQYYYSTVEYQIGGTQIYGFSDTYSIARAWWSNNYTTFENIIVNSIEITESGLYDSVLEASCQHIADYFAIPSSYFTYGICSISQTYVTKVVNLAQGATSIYNQFTSGFAGCVFSVSYQPLNSFRISFNKPDRDEDVPVTQLDTSQSGVTSLDDFALAEQDKANRLGNDVVAIRQRAESLSDIHALNSTFTGISGESYTVFKIVTAYEPNYISVVYYASKNYVIRNYSVAIQTKYRAYQYVNYGQAVVRKEQRKVYARLSTNYFYGDDELLFSDGDTSYPYTGGKYLLAAVTGEGKSWPYLQYGYCAGNITYPTAKYVYMKNELSAVSVGSSIVLSYQDFDNVSPGIRVLPNGYQDVYKNGIGGLPQQWYLWNTGFWWARYTGFCGGVDYFSTGAVYETATAANAAPIYAEPSITGLFTPTSAYSPWIKLRTGGVYGDGLLVNKDNAEIINLTLQIEYYTDITWLSWTPMLADLCPYLRDTSGYTWYAVAGTSTLDSEPYAAAKGTLSLVSSYISLTADGYKPPYLKLLANGPFIITAYDGTNYHDILAVGSGGGKGSVIYLTLNDTKTEHVWQVTDGLPHTLHVVALNDTGRNVGL